MRIKWLGHASFLITSDTGTKIITDPFEASYVASGGSSYGDIEESADIVTVSHDHTDHSNVATVKGKPEVIRKAGITKVKGMEFKGIASHHDEAGGSKRGNNTMFCFEMDGIRVCHLGDLGHQLSDQQSSELGDVDILLIPVGGYYTIDAKVATQVWDQLKPKVAIPMHFKTDKCGFPIAGVDEFLKGKEAVKNLDTSEVEFKQKELPSTTQIIVLQPDL